MSLAATPSSETLPPHPVVLRLGNGHRLLAQGRNAAALSVAEAVMAQHPGSVDALVLHGAACKALRRFAPAVAAFEAAVAREPGRAAVWVSLGNSHAELGDLAAADHCLRRALALRPDMRAAHASLIGVCALRRDDAATEAACHAALAVDAGLVNAHQYLADILARRGEAAAARGHREAAYRRQNLFVEPAARPGPTVLVLLTAEDGNIPLKYLFSRDNTTLLKWLIAYASPEQAAALPRHDIVFNAVGEPDLPPPIHAAIEQFRQGCARPFLNPPERVLLTSREKLPALLVGVADAVVPPVWLCRAGEAAPVLPALVRPVGAHGGEGLALATTPKAFARALAGSSASYVTEFVDFQSPDGGWRKYRAIFVDRRAYPYHLAIADRWLVHYYTADMAADAARRAEEARFLADPHAAIGARALAALAAIGQRLDLDYAGIDFSVLADGRVLVFEANATMVVHPETEGGVFDYKNNAVRTILAAFADMVARRVGERS